MPVYGFRCDDCGRTEDHILPVAMRDQGILCGCGYVMTRQLAAPLFRFYGKVTPGGGMDKFTADMLGIPLKELPPGLKGQNDLS